jgi:dihydroxyacetone kinase-like predicted kinase
MMAALEDVRDGEVTMAIRDSQCANGDPIHAGDIIGIQDGEITVTGSSVSDVTVDLIRRMQEEEEGDTLTILAGEDLSDEDFKAICDRIEEEMGDLEVDAHRGDQPLYPIIFSIE